jgi:hypothetical protein
MTELTLIANSANLNPAINFVLLSFGMQHAETIQKSMTDTYHHHRSAGRSHRNRKEEQIFVVCPAHGIGR